MVSIIFATLGILSGLFGLLGLSQTNPASLDDATWAEALELLKEVEWLSDEDKEAVAALDKSFVQEIIESPRVRLFGYLLLGFGFICNVTLLYLGYTFARGRVTAVWAFVSLLLCEAAYTYGAPYVLMSGVDTPFALELAGAWGIGNSGLYPMLLTHFWFWAPAVAILLHPKMPLFQSLWRTRPE